MQAEFRRDINHQYMVIPLKERKDADYRIRMLTENTIPHFAACRMEHVDGSELLYYDVTDTLQVSAYLETHRTDKELYIRLLRSLAEAMDSIQDYLLGPDGILADAERIFMNIRTQKLTFVYFPDADRNFAESCRLFSENLLHKMKHDDEETVRIGYGFYRRCVSFGISSEILRDIAEGRFFSEEPKPEMSESKEDDSFLWGNTRVGVESLEKMPDLYDRSFRDGGENEKVGFFKKIFGRSKKDRRKKIERNELREEKSVNSHNTDAGQFGDETNKYENNETVLLKRDESRIQIRAWLIPERGFEEEAIPLVNEKYFVGKKRAGADITPLSEAVSRLHAMLLWCDGTYCIADLGSKNGTKINDKKIDGGTRVPLRDSNVIMFADAVCIYRQSEL